MQKLYTTPYGSRLYGTNDENSDYDWKTIIMPDLADLLVGVPIKNQFFSTANEKVKNTSEDTDTELVPIQVFCKDFFAGQTYAIEIAFGALQRINIEGVEVHDERFLSIVTTLTKYFLTANINAMVGYAYHQSQLYSAKGDRLDKLHTFRDYLVSSGNDLGLVLDDKLGKILDVVDVEKHPNLFDKLLSVTKSPNPDGSFQRCFNILEKLYPEGISIAEAIRRVDLTINKYGARANAAMVNEGKDWKAISHAVRITEEALSILNDHYLTMPLEQEKVDLFKSIKYGTIEWNTVQAMLISNIDEIEAAQLRCKLPIATDDLKAEFDAWLKATMMDLYGVNE